LILTFSQCSKAVSGIKYACHVHLFGFVVTFGHVDFSISPNTRRTAATNCGVSLGNLDNVENILGTSAGSPWLDLIASKVHTHDLLARIATNPLTEHKNQTQNQHPVRQLGGEHS